MQLTKPGSLRATALSRTLSHTMVTADNASDIAPVVMTERLLRLPDDMLSTYRLTAPVHRILSLQTAFVAGCCQQAQF